MQQQVVTTLVSHEPLQVNGSNGPFTIHKFKDAGGVVYQTTKQDIANTAFGLLNQSVQITFEAKQRGNYTNNEIAAILPSTGAVAGAAAAPAPATAGAPAPNQGAPAGGGMSPERELKIMRQHAMTDALAAIGLGVLPKPESRDQLFQIADILVGYYDRGRQAVNQPAAVTQPQGQAAAAPPAAAPTGGGDANGGSAEQATPVAAVAAAPQGPSDDIPF